jgi:multicomponent Na+:H+ antiporter subunit D
LVLNFLSSSIFLLALGLLYGKIGSLNMADVAVKIRLEDSNFVLPTAVLFFVAFTIKAGLFPLFFWLPASYHTPAASVSALFAGLLTKVGVYALLRIFTLVFPLDQSFLQDLLLWLSIATMIVGVLGAAAQFEIRRILSWHIISQIGYMTLALAFFTEAAFTACVFYVIHHILVKTNLFLISGAVAHAKGTCNLKKIGGLYTDAPGLAILFLIPALSLGGIPPLSGFFAKLVVTIEGLRLAQWFAVGVALAVGLLTLFSMTKIWAEAFWKADPNAVGVQRQVPAAILIPIGLFCAATLALSFAPQTLLAAAETAAASLANTETYINAVLERAGSAALR